MTLRIRRNAKTLLVSVAIGTAITFATWFVAVPITMTFSQSWHILSQTAKRGFPITWVIEAHFIATGSEMQLNPLGLAVDIIFWSAIAFVVLFLLSKIVKLSKPRKPPDET